MYHFYTIPVTFTSSISSKTFNVDLYKGAIFAKSLATGVSAGSYDYPLADVTIADDGDYVVRVTDASNALAYNESKAFTIHNKLKCGFSCGSRL